MARWGWGEWGPGARLIQAAFSVREEGSGCSLFPGLTPELPPAVIPTLHSTSLSSGSLEVSSALFRSTFSDKTEPF